MGGDWTAWPSALRALRSPLASGKAATHPDTHHIFTASLLGTRCGVGTWGRHKDAETQSPCGSPPSRTHKDPYSTTTQNCPILNVTYTAFPTLWPTGFSF